MQELALCLLLCLLHSLVGRVCACILPASGTFRAAAVQTWQRDPRRALNARSQRHHRDQFCAPPQKHAVISHGERGTASGHRSAWTAVETSKRSGHGVFRHDTRIVCPERSCVYGHDSPASQTGPRKEVVRTDKAPAAVGPYSQVRLTLPSRRYATPAQCRQQSRGVLMALVALHQ